MNLNHLSMAQEFSFQSEQSNQVLDGARLANGEGAVNSEEEVDVYDVLLAGVSNDEN